MAKIIRKETRKRGIIGWFFLLAFIAFNIFMAFGLFAGINNASKVQAASDAERAGQAIGTVLGSGFLLFIWLAGVVILGFFVLLSRGRKIIVEETVE
ncbi:MAG: hypothetical protein J0H18_03165 [Rhizobiales bacterium]|nr:hypothetical protein [Hyphomicrobiales bacterium]OJY06658.1 MAG: hypothetical protein BGP07_16570 [Rhizobiales bacterium 63-22]